LKQSSPRNTPKPPAFQTTQAGVDKHATPPPTNGVAHQDNAHASFLASEQEQQQQIDRYKMWLTNHASKPQAQAAARDEYYARATTLIRVNGKKVRTFAPFNPDFSAVKTVTPEQAIILVALVALWALVFFFYGIPTLVTTISVVTAIYLGDLLLSFFLATRILSKTPEDRIDNAVVRAIPNHLWPRYTVLCPLYHEAVIIPQFVRAMSLLDYPVEKLEILLITEEDDLETRNAIFSMDLPAHFDVVTVPPGEPRTKPRACNFGLLKSTGDYTVIYDAEDIPDPLQLKKAVLAFANQPPEVVCIQAKLNYYNPNQNLLTRWFTAEYSLWFDLMLPALQKVRASIPLGGTSNHFRTAVLRQVGAWDPFNVTEDCDLGLRLAHYGFQTAILDSTTYEEANSRLKNWVRQRSRWIKGYMQSYFVHMRHPLSYLREGRLRDFFWMQYTVGIRVALLFINPLMWLLLALYVIFQDTLTPAYHILYPRPVLYLGTASLIFGNFFFLYTHLVGCLRRKQYSLMIWTFLIPLYWALMSVAASIALVQLIFKPHYWEKTQHGFHLLARRPSRASKKRKEASDKTGIFRTKTLLKEKQVSDLPIAPIIDVLSTWRMPAIQAEFPMLDLAELRDKPDDQLSAVVDLPTTQLAAVTQQAMPQAATTRRKRSIRLPWTKDRWLVATILTAVVMSLVAFWYSYNHQYILLYGDAYPHLKIARSIFDSITPGIAQFGGVWLPLPHIIMLPFIWVNQLWLSGLAGSFSSMPCYVIAATYLFLSARRLTQNSMVSCVATLAFILNPNALYLQTTPLTEPVLMATMTAACYYFLAWAQDNDPKQLIWAAFAMFLATLARYDGWALFLACLALIVPIGLLRRQRRGQIISNVLIFSTLGGFGIALWFLWCTVIFHDPLYFQHGPFSSELQQQGLAFAGRLYTQHNIWESLRFYTITAVQTVGPILFVLACAALLIFLLRRWRSPETLGALAFWAPFVFYVVALYTGQAAIYTPGAAPANALQFYNVRYGSEIIVPTALFLATLLDRLPLRKLLLPAATIVLLIAIVGQSFLTFSGGVIALQDGQFGASCAPTSAITIYLAQHYNGGLILEDPHFGSNSDIMGMIGIDLKNVVEPGNGALWNQALNDPGSVADWVIIGPGDLLSRKINPNSAAFLAEFTLVQESKEGSDLFYRRGLPPPPTRPVSQSLLNEHHLCPGSTDNIAAPLALSSATAAADLTNKWAIKGGLGTAL
jgi:cellulose synthase/poly-beta-1,6-N-acetylglucosamine synthase-like glycosyltransferase